MTRQLHPLVSADVALFSLGDVGLQVLLVQRAEDPLSGRWALPGAVLKPDRDDTLEQTARRALRDKAGVEVPFLAQLRTFDGRYRDPRGWSVSVLHWALLPKDLVPAVAGRKVEALGWFSADAPPPGLAFDHELHLSAARSALRERVRQHALPLHLMPARFTLTDLQVVCERILSSSDVGQVALDKGAFRRRFAASPDIQKIEGEFERGPQRPAQYYRMAAGFSFEVR